MFAYLIALLVMALVVTLAVLALRSVLQAWVDYRVRVRLLQHADKHPEFDATLEMTPSPAVEAQKQSFFGAKQNFIVTGGFLAAIGVGCIVTGRFIRFGQLVVGIYVGGIFCIVIGLCFSLIGVLIYTFAARR
ncbi:MAG: hypothetical protein KJ052_11515 [Candidatus Hydrogenedentes bacterium]|nr:hypothetical protein [Candidatus Hydrogenedentota bacterium]